MKILSLAPAIYYLMRYAEERLPFIDFAGGHLPEVARPNICGGFHFDKSFYTLKR